MLQNVVLLLGGLGGIAYGVATLAEASSDTVLARTAQRRMRNRGLACCALGGALIGLAVFTAGV